MGTDGPGLGTPGKFPSGSSPLENHLRVLGGTSELLTGSAPYLSVWQQKCDCFAEAQEPGGHKDRNPVAALEQRGIRGCSGQSERWTRSPQICYYHGHPRAGHFFTYFFIFPFSFFTYSFNEYSQSRDLVPEAVLHWRQKVITDSTPAVLEFQLVLNCFVPSPIGKHF